MASSHLLVYTLLGTERERGYRQPPAAHFLPYRTTVDIFTKLYSEQRRLDSLALFALLPFLQHFNNTLRRHVDKEEGFDLKVVRSDVVESAVSAIGSWLETMSKLSIQSLCASIFLRAQHSYTSAIVYAWDVYPKLHQEYLGRALRKVGLGRFRTLLGPKMTPQDLLYFEQGRSGLLVAFEDSLLRQNFIAVGEVSVSIGKALFSYCRTRRTRELKRKVVESVTLQCGFMLSRACGAAIGQCVSSARSAFAARRTTISAAPVGTGCSEYYGELIAALLFAIYSPLISTYLIQRIEKKGQDSEKK